MISYLSQNSQLSILVIKKISAPETNNQKNKKKFVILIKKKISAIYLPAWSSFMIIFANKKFFLKYNLVLLLQFKPIFLFHLLWIWREKILFLIINHL